MHRPKDYIVFSYVNDKFNGYTYKWAVFALTHFLKFSPASHSDLIIHNPQAEEFHLSGWLQLSIKDDAGMMGKSDVGRE